MMRRMLEKSGWSVIEAENGKIGLDRMSEALPGVILLDLTMPVMDGFEFAAELRRREDWRTVPIIVLTAKDLTVAESKRLAGSAARVLQKGAVNLDDLADHIRSLIPASM
jgi:CheY-like chemotaxis protein